MTLLNPTVPRTYIALFAFFMSALAEADSSPPTLNAISINKVTIDVREEPQTLIATVDATDESGIDWGVLGTSLVFRDQGGSFHRLRGNNENPGELRIDISSDDVGGVWGLQWLNLEDIHGNKQTIRNLGDYGMPGSIEIIGGKENEPPTLNAISINKVTIDVREEPQTLIATVDATDESGIDWGVLGTSLVFRDQGGSFHRLRGNNENPGELRIDISSDDVGGVWGLQWLNLEDIHGNKQTIRNLGDYGIPTYIYVLKTDELTSNISLSHTGLLDTLGENYQYEMVVTASNLASNATSVLDLSISSRNLRITSVSRDDGALACSLSSANYDSNVSCESSDIDANSNAIFRIAITGGITGSASLNIRLVDGSPDVSLRDNYIYVNTVIEPYVDTDNDGVSDDLDAFPLDPTETVDSDSDGIGDNSDQFPNDPNEWLDTDGDGVGNNADPDDDNDGVEDGSDAFPLNSTESIDTDGDGIGDNADTDDDGDGFLDREEEAEGTDPLNADEFPALNGLPLWMIHVIQQLEPAEPSP